jgi:phage tail-like protein
MSNIIQDPLLNYRFRIEIEGEGMESMGFSKMSELSNETKTTPYKEGGLNNRTYYLPEHTEYSTITLEHGLSLDQSLYDWRQDVIDGNMLDALKDGLIKIYREDGEYDIWEFHGAWPSKLVVSGFDATGSGDILVESIELVIERFERY